MRTCASGSSNSLPIQERVQASSRAREHIDGGAADACGWVIHRGNDSRIGRQHSSRRARLDHELSRERE